MLIQAFEVVAKKLPNAWLAVCGMPDTLKGMVRDLPAGIRARVLELPMTESDAELRRYYGLMDVFVHLADRGESFGMVLCEAMLSGRPVITMSTPLRDNSQIEVVQHKKTGIVVQNLRQTIEAMLACKEDQAAYESARRQAPIWVREQYDIPVVTQKLLAIARIALAAASPQDMVRRLVELPGAIAEAPAGLYRDLLSSAGIKQSWQDSVLTPLVNRPTSLLAISLIRPSASRFTWNRKERIG